MAHRRLAHGKDTPPEKWGWKPFGFVDYGYEEQYQTLSSFTIWALVTLGSFSVDPLEAILVFGGSLAWSEYSTRALFPTGKLKWGTGASWIHNVQAGYCWYHYFVKGQKQLPLLLGSWAEVAGDLGAVVEESLRGEHMYSHKAHYEGASIGMIVAMLLDKFNFSSKPTLWKAIPLLTIAALMLAEMKKEKLYLKE